MQISFISGFGPISRSQDASLGFWADAFGLRLDELAPGYFHSEGIDGAKAFAIWPLEQAAESTFGVRSWPSEHPVPQAWIEFDVASPAAVGEAVEELEQRGHEVLRGATEEPWGQTTARLLSPEGLLVGVSYLPSMHQED